MVDFLIEDKVFTMPEDFHSAEEFTVKSTPKNYGVTIKNNPEIVKEIQAILNSNPNNLVLIDKNVYDLYFKELKIPSEKIYIAEATEKFKTINGVLDVIAFLEKNEFTKGEKLVVIGGGIMEDVGAFVGASYKRGINWIYYPTTLLSMCDSCIGGKTGINHNGAKNQLALFSAPSKVVINIGFLKTLSEFDIKSGMGEILKLLVTGGKKPVEVYENEVENGHVKSFDSYKPLILSSLAVKKAVIEVDEFDLNYRKSLNYGHTVGHAIEALSKYKIPHGQAVIMGMVIVNKLALNRGILNKKDYELTQELAHELLGKSILKEVSLDDLGKLLKKDKKTIGNMVNFVIISELGDTKFLKIELNKELTDEIDNIIKQEF